MNEPISNHCYYIEYMVPVRLRAAEHLDSDLLSLLADFFSKLNYASHQGPGIDVTEWDAYPPVLWIRVQSDPDPELNPIRTRVWPFWQGKLYILAYFSSKRSNSSVIANIFPKKIFKML